MRSFSDRKIGCERWHKSQQFDWLGGKVPFIVEPRRLQKNIRSPSPTFASDSKICSLYPRKDQCELPSWIIYDKQVLSFDAYFEDLFEPQCSAFRKRRVKIIYFLEDGTMQINEEKLKNCGFSQGTLIGRRRIPFPNSMDKAFYEVIDLNIGKAAALLGRTYFIVDCDKFTRHWLNRSGIAVPESLLENGNQAPEDEKTRRTKKSIGQKPDKLGQFLKCDGHVLRFYTYWDDRGSMGGDIHKLTVHYYLSDDTIDVREEGGSMLLARTRLPKDTSGVPAPGALTDTHLLNVLTTGYLHGRTVKDSQLIGHQDDKYYTDADLLPGATVNIYGRAVTFTDCDQFTRDFYSAKYGIDQFKIVSVPPSDASNAAASGTFKELPPWNGFGTFEDSAGNCGTLVPKINRSKGSLLLGRARTDREGHILRFRARMIATNAIDAERFFIVNFYLVDNTTSVFEMAPRNSGFEQRMFIKRKEAFKPTETLLVSRKPNIYTKEDFWVGNQIEIDKFKFELLEADEFTTGYMETNHQEFPKNNIDLILDKVRSKLSKDYKSFVQKYLLPEGEQKISESALSEALKALMGEEITRHEIAALARHFTVQESRKYFDKERLRDVCRNECRRHLYNGFDRLSENLFQIDENHTGHLARNDAYALCRGAGIPIDRVVMRAVLEEVEKNERGHVSIKDLLSFFDPNENPCTSLEPINHIKELSSQPVLQTTPKVDCIKLIKSLRLEEALKNEN